MVLRHAHTPELPEMDPFLFAPVREEVNGSACCQRWRDWALIQGRKRLDCPV